MDADARQELERAAYSQREVAEMLGKAPETVARWIREGRLRARKVAGSVLITKEALEEFLSGEGSDHGEAAV